MSEQAKIKQSRIRQIIGLLDLTHLGDECSTADIKQLCSQANTACGAVAAVCIWPRFVAAARDCLGASSPIQIATVINFPTGDETVEQCCKATDKALRDGAAEIDIVIPYKQLAAGNTAAAVAVLRAVQERIPDSACMKVILETGELGTVERIRDAAVLAMDNGADFIKTSTGKVPINATAKAAGVMLDVIAQKNTDIGFKAAGGIKTVDEATLYLQLAEERLGEAWVTPSHMRFGASSLLHDALAALNINSTTPLSSGESY